MYNLTVAEVHTFIVGEGEWVVHNCLTVEVAIETAITRAQKLAAQAVQDPSIIPSNATGAAVTVVVDMTDGSVYHAFSGTLDSLAEVHPEIRDILPMPSAYGVKGRQSWMCGEPAACTRALFGGADLRNSVIATVTTATGDIKPPCLNCERWVYDVFAHVVDGK